jgi:hypothetical protein
VTTTLTWEQFAPAVVGTLVGALTSGIWAWFNQRGRQGFERRMAEDSRTAQQALETLKTELTLDGEVRRQGAARKVVALLKIDPATIALLKVLLDDGCTGDERFEAILVWSSVALEAEPLLTVDALSEVEGFRASMRAAHSTLELKTMGKDISPVEIVQAHKDLRTGRVRLLEMVRRELQIDPSDKLEKRL